MVAAVMSVTREKAYVGETKTQLRHGYGVYKYSNQFFRYEGEWKHGKKHGHGKLLMADGSYYEGEFINGEIEGHGFRKWAASGNTYSGQFCNGELNGYGVMNYRNGAVYEGEFQCNKKEGRGIMKYEDGSIYQGLFHENLRHGEGSLTFSNGDCYIGDWVKDRRQGSGELRFKNGSVYDGQWRSDLYNGAGTFIHSSGVTYEGMWINGRPAVEAAKIVITTEEYRELSQDAPFSITIEIQSEDGQVVADEQGRELHIAAGFKHRVPGQGSPLLALIEDLEETPASTPYYKVISYPITEYSFMVERLRETDDPPSGTTDSSPLADDETADDIDESVANLDLENNNDTAGMDTLDESPGDLAKCEDGGKDKEDVTNQPLPEICATDVADTMVDVCSQDEERAVAESPIPPPVGNGRSKAGQMQFEGLILPGIPSTGETPLPVSPLSSSSLSNKSTKGKAKGGKTKGSKGAQDELTPPPDQVNFEKIKDPKIAKAKRERLYGDERFARPGEYVIIISDVTEPPFMGTRLPPAYCRIKILHPRKTKREKLPAKSRSSSKLAE